MKTEKTLFGVVLMLLSCLILAVQDGLSKYLSSLYPVLIVIWVRYLTQLFLLLGSCAPRQGWQLVKTQRPMLQLARGISLVSLSLCFFSSLIYLPIGEATAVLFLSPLFVVIFSALVLKESIKPVLWLCVVLGLLGVLMIVRPGGDLFRPAALLPLLAAVFLGIYQLLTRRLSATDSPVTSNFLTAVVGSLVTSALVPFVWQAPESWAHMLMMIALGSCSVIGHMLMTHAYGYASAATLSPFTYAQIVFAVLTGVLVFGHTPDAWALLGIAVIVGSGVLMALSANRAAKGAR